VNPSRPYGSLFGRWSGASGCTLVFRKDDGSDVEGSCDDINVRHQVTGFYVGDDSVAIVITRIDEKQCSTIVSGYVKIESRDVIEAVQDGWNGCGVQTPPARTRLRRG